MALLKVKGEPLVELPPNVVVATGIRHIDSAHRLGCVDEGAYERRNDPFHGLYLMSWGLNATRETVLKYAGRRFVWVGTCADESGLTRDNFEEAY